MVIQKKYICLPYNNNMALKTLEFYNNGKLVYDLKIALDFLNPNNYAFVDFSRFACMELKIVCKTPEYSFEVPDEHIIQTDTIYENNLENKPFNHFTVKSGWMSDPNGLVYANNTYHMFFQYNPTGVEKCNMHWGHAVSKDLLHWEEVDAALFPDDCGYIFSGCGIVDKRNLLKVKNSECDTIVLFYTAAGGTSQLSQGKDFNVCMAYSTDNGKTFIKHKKNPIVPNITQLNRDPNVVYCDDLLCYVMVLYLHGSKYCLLKSENLVDWCAFQTIELSLNSECPLLYSLCVDNDERQLYWILSGASDSYLVGTFKDGMFVPCQSIKKLHYGDCMYAPQVFSNTTGRVIRTSWMNILHTLSFTGQMSTICEMKLKKIEDSLYLCAWPISEISTLYANVKEHSYIEVSKEKPLMEVLDISALDIYIGGVYNDAAVLNINLFGISLICDMRNNSISCGYAKGPLSIKKDQFQFRIIIDKNSIEIFIDEGEFLLSGEVNCDYILNYMKITSNIPVSVEKIKIASLKNQSKVRI